MLKRSSSSARRRVSLALFVSTTLLVFAVVSLNDGTFPSSIKKLFGVQSSGESGLMVIPARVQAGCQPLEEGFDDTFDENKVFSGDFFVLNNSQPPSTANPPFNSWFQGGPEVGLFPAHEGDPNSFVAVGFNSGGFAADGGTISNWAMTPPLTVQNGDVFSFWARVRSLPAQRVDRLQVRLSTNGASTDVGTTAESVGDFTRLFLDINPNYTDTGFPADWTKFEAIVTGVRAPTIGRIAFRYFVEKGGPGGSRSNDLGIDTVKFTCGGGAPRLPPPPIVTGPGDAFAESLKASNWDASGDWPVLLANYETGFEGGTRVAAGDVTGDGVPDAIIGTGSNPALVRFYNGGFPSLIQEVNPEGFDGGFYIASADINNDGIDDLIVGADPGSPPRVTVISGLDFTTILAEFLAYDPSFLGGVRVAAGDFNSDGFPEIITSPGPGADIDIKVFSGDGGMVFDQFPAYPGFSGGVFVAAGDVNGDGKDDIITGADSGGAPHVKVFDGTNTDLELRSFFAYDQNFTGGVRVASSDINGDGFSDIITAPGPGSGPHVKVFSGDDGSELASFFAYDPSFQGGVFVASGTPVFPKVEISGQVLTSEGRGLRNAKVYLAFTEGDSFTSSQDETRAVFTSSLGFFVFENVPAGKTYTVSVVSKRYRFLSRTIQVSDSISNLDFQGLE